MNDASVTSAQLEQLREAVRYEKRVEGYSHNFYRYPARFSPVFARACIDAFTRPGDVVLDPFGGGGTTFVEAMASGRSAIGSDLNELACFVSRVKTTLLTPSLESEVRLWGERFFGMKVPHLDPSFVADAHADPVFTNILHSSTRPLLRYLVHGLEEASRINSSHARDFVRCYLLRLAQLSVDGRRFPDNFWAINRRATELFEVMLTEASLFRAQVREVTRIEGLGRKPFAKVFCGDSSQLHRQPGIKKLPTPDMVVTSPPYPGVHVLYHRWQVGGRKETPLPFWIAGCRDGHGASYYTLGDRKETELARYFRTLQGCFESLSRILKPGTPVIQLVAFAEPDWQIPRYMEVMRDAGFKSMKGRSLSARSLSRKVPNRRWHALLKGETPGSREVVLLHYRS